MSQLYIRNAMRKPLAGRGIVEFRRLSEKSPKALIANHRPSMMLTFGVSAFRIALFASGESPQRIYDTTQRGFGQGTEEGHT